MAVLTSLSARVWTSLAALCVFSTFETALTVSFIVFVKTSSEFVAADKSVSELCALLSSNTESAFAGFAIRTALKLVRSAAE